MEFIFEAVLEAVVEGIFGLTIHNPKVKTWVKTAVFLLMSEAVAGVFLWISFVAPVETGSAGNMVCRVIAIGLGIGFLIMAIYGHRRDWKQE